MTRHRMKNKNLVIAMICFTTALLSGCAKSENINNDFMITLPATYSFDFEKDEEGFEAVFSDYHDDGNNYETYEMKSDYTTIPVADISSKGLYIASMNRSDDMFMGYIKEITGLPKDQSYAFDISFKLATNVEAGGFGIGGSPGAAVFIKAGIASEKPEIQKDDNGVYHFTNLDTGSQKSGGKDLLQLGNIEKPEENWVEGFMFKSFTTSAMATTNSNGSVFLIIGSDSGYEGFTEYYIDDVSVVIHSSASVK